MSGKQHSTGLLPPRTGSKPNVPYRFCPGLNERGLLCPVSQVTAWPHSCIGLTGHRANVA